MSERDDTLNTVMNVFRGVIVALASATRSDMGEIADVMMSLSESPQFDSNARKMLEQLAKEMGVMRSPKA